MATLLIDGPWDRHLLETPQGVWFELPGALKAEIMELSRLEKSLKIMKSDCQHGTTVMLTTKHHLCPQMPHLHIFWALPGMVTPPFLWAACSGAWQPFPWNYYFPKYPIWASPGATWGNFLLYLSRSLQSHRDYPVMGSGGRQTFFIASIKFAFSFWIRWNFAFSCYCDGCVQMLD